MLTWVSWKETGQREGNHYVKCFFFSSFRSINDLSFWRYIVISDLRSTVVNVLGNNHYKIRVQAAIIGSNGASYPDFFGNAIDKIASGSPAFLS